MASPGIAAAAPGGRPLIIGLGDSWFHYFAIDVFDVLNEEYGLDAVSLAREGTPLQALAEDPDQLIQLAALLADSSARGRPPRAILLSAGGNDVVSPNLELLLRLAPGAPVLDPALAAEWVDINLREALTEVLDAITRLCIRHLGAPVPILIHGYDDPVPDGRGLIGTAWRVWLKTGFEARGYRYQQPPVECIQAMSQLITRFCAMQRSVAGLARFRGHVHAVDLRGVLSSKDYRADWGNELHPTPDGFRRVTKAIVQALLDAVPGLIDPGVVGRAGPRP
jgi:lysophospholipase L1-like esterase